MRPRALISRQTPLQSDAGWTLTIESEILRALFRARYFLKGVLIGAIIVLAVFLVME